MSIRKIRRSATFIALSVMIISILIFSDMDYSKGSDDMGAGASHMIIDGGSKGKVNFDHGHHQKYIGDCNICHTIFPKSEGAIVDLKRKGELKRKQVMNKLCLKCHRAEKMAGNPHGPTTCSKCHVR